MLGSQVAPVCGGELAVSGHLWTSRSDQLLMSFTTFLLSPAFICLHSGCKYKDIRRSLERDVGKVTRVRE